MTATRQALHSTLFIQLVLPFSRLFRRYSSLQGTGRQGAPGWTVKWVTGPSHPRLLLCTSSDQEILWTVDCSFKINTMARGLK